MNHRILGAQGPRVSALGLGLMGMSELYAPTDDAEYLATLQAALDAGVTLLDTGDFYGMGHGELLLRDALRGRRRENAVLSIRFGVLRDPAGGWVAADNRPAAVKNFLAYSLRRLNTDYIDIYRPTRLDPAVPLEETIGAIADMVKAGYVRHIGLSEVGAATLRRAQAVHPISDLQIEYSLLSRGIEAQILPTARELGIGVTAYGVLSRGLLSGLWSHERQKQLAAHDFRNSLPRFQGDNLTRNLALATALRKVAEAKNTSAARIAIAWVAAQGEDIVPLVGARRRGQLVDVLGAQDLTLSPADLTAIELAVPSGAAAGNRYAEPLMSMLDSER